jgi:hypothetical protein
VIDVAAGGDHPHVAAGADEAERLARRAHPDLDLRADAQPLDVLPQGVGQELVPLVAAVEPDLLAEQARRDADLQFQRSPFN